jgi:hypothetical protein
VSRGEHGSSLKRIRINFLVQELKEKIEGPGKRTSLVSTKNFKELE